MNGWHQSGSLRNLVVSQETEGFARCIPMIFLAACQELENALYFEEKGFR